jgi:hypothetical protein
VRGPIDYIIVGFKGNKFNGSILKAIDSAIEKNIIDLIGLAVINKDKKGSVAKLDIANLGDEYAVGLKIIKKMDPNLITQDDLNEVAELLEKNTSAGLLVIEQLWAKPLKKALLDADGVLVAEGRIHPDAAFELNNKEKKHAGIT